MLLFCEERFEQDFQFDRLKQTIRTVMQSAVITPKSFYYFIQRYSYFNGHAAAAGLASSLALSQAFCCDAAQTIVAKSDRRFDRVLDYSLLHAVGDYAQLSVPERHRMAQVPAWLTEVVEALVSQYQTSGDDIAALVRTLGFYTASEMMGNLENLLLDQVVHPDCSWRYIMVHRQPKGRGNYCQLALNTLNMTLDDRSELPEQIKAWVYEGYQNFIDLQQRLFYEIYRESLELQYWESDLPVSQLRLRPTLSQGSNRMDDLLQQ
jgi:hypothetical protein